LIVALPGCEAGDAGSGSSAETGDRERGSAGASTSAPLETTPTPTSVPTATPEPAIEWAPRLVEHGPRTRKKLALTFDADMTTGMLSRLKAGQVRSYHNRPLIRELRRLKVPATLFLSGLWMREYRDETRALARDPLFELGTHTWSHRAFTGDCYGLPVAEQSQLRGEILRAQRLLDRLAGPASTPLFRFPGGCYDAGALAAAEEAGVIAVQFDVAGGDGFQPDPDFIVRQVVEASRAGSIVVLHMNGADTSPRTDEALPDIVRGLRARGYELTKVSELLGL
jgi:hypothetical protein